MKQTLKTSLASAGVVGLVAALAGCGNLLEAGADRIGDAVQDQWRENLDFDIQVGDNATLPAGYPESIPHPDGRIVGALGVGGGWSVSYELNGPQGIDPMVDALKAQGYCLEQDQDQDGSRFLAFQGDEYTVAVVLIVGEDAALAQVTVTPVSE